MAITSILGWDIGGVNTKAALVVNGEIRDVRACPFELQRAPDRLPALLADTAAAMHAGVAHHAVTMTAELSQMFRTKREGVGFVLDAMERAFPAGRIQVYATDGSFLPPAVARTAPLRVAGANWAATADIVAQDHPDALLIDVGTTTTDVIPIVGGAVAAAGRTDPARLASGELVYTGAVRTPVEAVVRDVPFGGGRAGVSAEGFALTGDVHVWLEDLAPSDYDAATPDGRPADRACAAERLARVVCADREMLEADAITALARAVAEAQIEQVAAAIGAVRARHPSLRVAVVTGLGSFIAAAAARRLALDVVPLSAQFGAAGARSAAATAVALLLARQPDVEGEDRMAGRIGPQTAASAGLGGGERVVADSEPGSSAKDPVSNDTSTRPAPVIVVKVGGGLLADPDAWDAALTALADAAGSRRVVIVPGGGPFADAVRHVHTRVGLSDAAAHWMAIAGMDQHAEMIAASRPAFIRVLDPVGIASAHARGQVPVLAPSAWLRAADPLPRSWDVTSDSIAAWVAGVLRAGRLLLVKPAGASGPGITDGYFERALPPGLRWSATDAFLLRSQLQGREPDPR